MIYLLPLCTWFGRKQAFEQNLSANEKSFQTCLIRKFFSWTNQVVSAVGDLSNLSNSQQMTSKGQILFDWLNISSEILHIKGILRRSANFWYIVELIFVIPKTLFIFLFESILTPLWASKSVKLRVLVLVGTQKWLSMALKNGYPKDSGHPKLAIRT